MNRKICSLTGRIALLAFLGMMLLPVTAFGQRRWRPYRNRVVIYQPRPPVIYQRRPVYRYRYDNYRYAQPYYSTQYYSNGYTQPYYTNRYYSDRYSRSYYVNRYGRSSPRYRDSYYGYQPRYRRSGLSMGIRLR